MAIALMLAVVLVYMILAAQFDSVIHPFTIMLSLPFAVVGAFGGLFLAGMTLNIFSAIGFIMLMGLVTKNAILLVDFTNQLKHKGLSTYDALMQAGPIRLRPILMTTFAMIFGMFPVALALGEGGETRAPMAVAVIGGLITSTLLTLLVVPVFYTIADSFVGSRPVRWLGRRVTGAGSMAVDTEGNPVGTAHQARNRLEHEIRAAESPALLAGGPACRPGAPAGASPRSAFPPCPSRSATRRAARDRRSARR